MRSIAIRLTWCGSFERATDCRYPPPPSLPFRVVFDFAGVVAGWAVGGVCGKRLIPEQMLSGPQCCISDGNAALELSCLVPEHFARGRSAAVEPSFPVPDRNSPGLR
jgi:hypothetical protein